MRLSFHDYIAMVILPHTCWQVLRLYVKLCHWTFFQVKEASIVELVLLTIKSGKKRKKSNLDHLNMSIFWLQLLKSLILNEFVFAL